MSPNGKNRTGVELFNQPAVLYYSLAAGLTPNGTHFKQLSLSSGYVLGEFASKFRLGASARRFTKSQSESHLANAIQREHSGVPTRFW